jgi:hypothetical protein
VSGCVEKVEDEDRFSFEAKKGDKLVLELQSASLGFPLDARLKIEDAKAKELAADDDSSNADPSLEWTAPEDGKFVAAVSSVLHRGGPDYRYRLSIGKPVPALNVTAEGHAFAVEPGKTNEIKVKLKRLHGFAAKLAISVSGLPEGVRAESDEITDKSDAKIRLVAASEAKPFNGPLQILARETESGREHRAVHELVTTGIDNGVPNGFNRLVIESTDQLWLTVLPAPPASPKPENSKP